MPGMSKTDNMLRWGFIKKVRENVYLRFNCIHKCGLLYGAKGMLIAVGLVRLLDILLSCSRD